MTRVCRIVPTISLLSFVAPHFIGQEIGKEAQL